jgi:hypothetical protein
MYWNIGVIALVIGLFTTFLSGDNFRIYGIILLLSGSAMIMFEYCGGVHRVQDFLEEGDDYERFLEEGKEDDERFLDDEQRKLDKDEKYLTELERKNQEKEKQDSE